MSISLDAPEYTPVSEGGEIYLVASVQTNLTGRREIAISHRNLANVYCGFTAKVPEGFKLVLEPIPELREKGIEVYKNTITGEGRVSLSIRNLGREIVVIQNRQGGYGQNRTHLQPSFQGGRMSDYPSDVSCPSMTFNYYQKQAFGTAKYPDKGTGSVLALAYTALGLGEQGEVQGKVKKILRDQGGVVTDANREAIVAEMGDVLWYLGAMCTELGVDLGDVAKKNLDKLYDRKARDVISGSGDNR